MNLINRHIATWMTEESVFSGIFGLDTPSTRKERHIMVGGKVVGETPGVGLWVELEGIWDENGAAVFPEVAERRAKRLIRWDLLENAEVLPQAPSKDTVGFRPR